MEPSPAIETTGKDDRDLTEEVLASIRQRVARTLWLVGWILGAPAVLYIAARLWTAPAGPRAVVVTAVFAAMLGVLAFARKNPSRRLMGAVLALMAALPSSALFVLGPGPGSAAGFVAVGILATVFVGRRAGLAWCAAAALLFAAAVVLQGRGDEVGPAGLWNAPRWLAINGTLTSLAWLVLSVTAMGGVTSGLKAALDGHRDALRRERVERDGRLASERALAAASRLEAIGRLSAGVVHDTRNAMTVLRSGLDELERRTSDPAGLEILSDMRSAVESSQETMRQLLSLGADPAAAATEVAVLDRVERFARAVGRVLPASFAVRVEPRGTGHVLVSPGLLDQALLNLTLNARDAMPEGGALRLGVTGGEDGGKAVVIIEVEDEGQGIPPELAARLFEPFTTSKAGGKGTGLGLTMVQGFVTSAGGRIEVASRRGRGTRFRMILPSLEPTTAGRPPPGSGLSRG